LLENELAKEKEVKNIYEVQLDRLEEHTVPSKLKGKGF